MCTLLIMGSLRRVSESLGFIPSVNPFTGNLSKRENLPKSSIIGARDPGAKATQDIYGTVPEEGG